MAPPPLNDSGIVRLDAASLAYVLPERSKCSLIVTVDIFRNHTYKIICIGLAGAPGNNINLPETSLTENEI